MKRLACALVFLLAIFLIANAKEKRAVSSDVAASQQEISALLDDLDARSEALQAELRWSQEILKRRN
jgi:hypothetical protein